LQATMQAIALRSNHDHPDSDVLFRQRKTICGQAR
jgi:hypothetical protein